MCMHLAFMYPYMDTCILCIHIRTRAFYVSIYGHVHMETIDLAKGFGQVGSNPSQLVFNTTHIMQTHTLSILNSGHP